MKLGTTEHYDMIASFEKYAKTSPVRVRFDKEPKADWAKGRIYQDMNTNDLFNLYCAGYASARCAYLQGHYDAA